MLSGRRAYWIAAAVAILLLLAPVLVAPRMPLLDAASHLARLAVLRHLLIDHVGSVFYGFDTLLLPNIGFDVAGLGLTALVGPLAAGRIFLAATLVIAFTGVLALGRVALGRNNYLALASALLGFNLFVILGFLSYSLGIALVFWALAARLRLLASRRSLAFLAGCVTACLLLLCHLSAFAVYAVMLAGIGLDLLVRHRRSLADVILMGTELLPAVLLYLAMSVGGQGRMHYDMPYWQNKIFNALKTVSAGSIPSDLGFVAGALAVLLLVLMNRPRIAAPLWPGLIMLSLLYFIVPPHVSGGSYVDSRLPVVIVMLLLAGLEIRPRGPIWVVPLAFVAACCLVIKQAALTLAWFDEARTLATIEAALRGLPKGAVLLQAECSPAATDIAGAYRSRQPPLGHVAALAAMRDQRFIAVSWTLKGQQPITTLPAYAPFKTLQDGVPDTVCTKQGYETVLRQASALLASQAALHAVVPPTFLLLLRSPMPGLLADRAELVASPGPVEIYKVP